MHVNKYVMTGLTQSSITVETVLRDLARDSYLGGGGEVNLAKLQATRVYDV